MKDTEHQYRCMHRREEEPSKGLQDSVTFSVAVPSAVGTDRLAAHKLLMWELKNKHFFAIQRCAGV